MRQLTKSEISNPERTKREIREWIYLHEPVKTKRLFEVWGGSERHVAELETALQIRFLPRVGWVWNRTSAD